MPRSILTDREWLVCSGVLTAGTGKPLTDEQMEVWFTCLCDIPFRALKLACLRALQECNSGFMPPIATIRQFAVEIMHGALPEASEEWAHVRRLVRRWGQMRRVEAFQQMGPITQEAVKAIGWDALCDMTDPTFFASQFRKSYSELASRESSMRSLSEEVRPKITCGDAVATVDRRLLDVAQKLSTALSVPKD